MKEAVKLVPEALFDLIARVVPGAILLSVYHPNPATFASSAGGVILGLVYAYVVGFTAEQISHLIVDVWVLESCCEKRLGISHEKYSWLPMTREKLWEYRQECPESIALKMLAERGCFRTLFLASLFGATFYPPERFGEGSLACLYCFVTALAFLNSFYWVSFFITERIERIKALRASQPAVASNAAIDSQEKEDIGPSLESGRPMPPAANE